MSTSVPMRSGVEVSVWECVCFIKHHIFIELSSVLIVKCYIYWTFCVTMRQYSKCFCAEIVKLFCHHILFSGRVSSGYAASTRIFFVVRQTMSSCVTVWRNTNKVSLGYFDFKDRCDCAWADWPPGGLTHAQLKWTSSSSSSFSLPVSSSSS